MATPTSHGGVVKRELQILVAILGPLLAERAARVLRRGHEPTIGHEGKHIAMTDGQRIITIPRHNPVNAFTMGGIARDAGLTPDEFWKPLQIAR